MKEHSFSTEFASKYGIEEAIIFGNIYYWCLQNKENGINLKKGDDGVARYYTYNSIASIQENYYYMTLSKVYRVMEKLEAEGLIVTGCFNKRVNDRTRWYAVTEKGEEIYLECEGKIRDRLYTEPHFSNCNLQNETGNLQNETGNLQNETGNLQNETGNLQNEMTLPNINSNINTNLNPNINTNIEARAPLKTKKPKKQKTEKHKYGEYENVLLSDDEYKKLVDKVGNEKADAVIQNFSELKEMKGYTYKSDYLALLKWGIRAYEEQNSRTGSGKNGRFNKESLADRDFFAGTEYEGATA